MFGYCFTWHARLQQYTTHTVRVRSKLLARVSAEATVMFEPPCHPNTASSTWHGLNGSSEWRGWPLLLLCVQLGTPLSPATACRRCRCMLRHVAQAHSHIVTQCNRYTPSCDAAQRCSGVKRLAECIISARVWSSERVTSLPRPSVNSGYGRCSADALRRSLADACPFSTHSTFPCSGGCFS